ncbi:MAG: agmatine deiminase family protein, partial [Bacteroidaceae bacterium]|nr:agmatine deiminase family protein [Bacteroidaceae bacterium]
MRRFLPAEWHPQQCVQLTWPHADTDWADILSDVEECYVRIAHEILLREPLLIVTPHPTEVLSLLQGRLTADEMSRVTFVQIDTNDTWARDHGFISLLDDEGGRTLLDFRFNGWGQKFAANLDNQICRRMAEQQVLEGRYESHLDLTLEGGSI